MIQGFQLTLIVLVRVFKDYGFCESELLVTHVEQTFEW
jgi:hypothetical protein